MTNPVSPPTKDYPPNTPDRPAPLSVKSRHSGKSSITPGTGYRSISAPTTRGNKSATAPFPRNTHMLEDTASQPLLVSPTSWTTGSGGHADADDVFSISGIEATPCDEPVSPIHVFDESRLRALNQLQGTAEVSCEYQQRIYELSHSESSSRTSDEAADGFRMLSTDEEVADLSLTQPTQVGVNGTLDTVPSHQEGPLCDSSISHNDRSPQTDQYTSSNAASDPFQYDRGTSRCRDTGLPRFKLKRRIPNVKAEPDLFSLPLRNFKNGGADGPPAPSPCFLPSRNYESEIHQIPSLSPRPLALRSNESEEKLQCSGSPRPPRLRVRHSDDIQSTETRNLRPLPLRMYRSKTHLNTPPSPSCPSRIPRLKGGRTMVREHRPTRLAVPSFHTTLRTNRGGPDQSPRHGSPLSRSQLSRGSPKPSQLTIRRANSEHSASCEDELSNHGSISEMLKDFPTPPLQTPDATPAENITPLRSLAKACHSSITTPATIKKMLGETRAHGEMLPVMDWAGMSAPERSWRENNEVLLVAIYGRQNTELSDEDVAYVDAISRSLRNEEVQRLMRIFKDEAEIF